VLKVQAAWGGGIFLENAKSYVDRVHAMAGKDLKIDLLSVNSVVKTSQMQDAVHRGVLDVAHYVTAYWYSKSKSAGYRFPPEIIRQAIWLYLRLTISLRGDEKARCRGSKAGDQPKGFSLFTRPSITPSMSNAS